MTRQYVWASRRNSQLGLWRLMLPWSQHPWQGGLRTLMCHMMWWLSRWVALRGTWCKKAFPNTSSSEVTVLTFYSHSACRFPSSLCSQEFAFKLQLFILQWIFSSHPVLKSFPWSRTELLLLLSQLSIRADTQGWSSHGRWRGGTRISSLGALLFCTVWVSATCQPVRRPEKPCLLPRTSPTTVTMAKRS